MNYKEILQLLNAGFTKAEIDAMKEEKPETLPTLEPSAVKEAEEAPEEMEAPPAPETATEEKADPYKEFAETMAAMRESMNVMKNELKNMKTTFQTSARNELVGKEMKPATLEEATQAAFN